MFTVTATAAPSTAHRPSTSLLEQTVAAAARSQGQALGGVPIGAGTMIAAQVSLSAGMVPGQDLGEAPVLRIGDRCVIGRGSHLVAHHSLVIGDDVFTGPYVYITDQNHGYEDPDEPIGRQMPLNAAVSIGSGCWLGTGAVVLPGASIGRNVVVAAAGAVASVWASGGTSQYSARARHSSR